MSLFDPKPTIYDLIVIGRGLVGSAAAKYAAEAHNASVVAVGPDEASQAQLHTYGCHADEARICRRLDPDPARARAVSRPGTREWLRCTE